MPNSLGHFGVQGVASRALFGRVDPRWVMAGCILPDVPWILQRVVRTAFPDAYPYDLRLYFVAQASLLGTFLLCGALAATSPKPRRILLLLAFNALLHLLLDACQIKWGNGVHLFAPLSWKLLNFGLFWPEQWPSHLLTATGVIYLGWASRRGLWGPLVLTARRWWLVLLFLGLYSVLPFLLIRSAYVANVHDARVLKEDQIGKPVAFDREEVVVGARGARLEPWNGEQYDAGKALPKRNVEVSLRGILTAPNRIRVEALHEHTGVSRDYGSIAGLGVLVAAVGVGLFRARNLKASPPSKPA